MKKIIIVLLSLTIAQSMVCLPSFRFWKTAKPAQQTVVCNKLHDFMGKAQAERLEKSFTFIFPDNERISIMRALTDEATLALTKRPTPNSIEIKECDWRVTVTNTGTYTIDPLPSRVAKRPNLRITRLLQAHPYLTLASGITLGALGLRLGQIRTEIINHDLTSRLYPQDSRYTDNSFFANALRTILFTGTTYE
jgi:hypothetical protein